MAKLTPELLKYWRENCDSKYEISLLDEIERLYKGLDTLKQWLTEANSEADRRVCNAVETLLQNLDL
jgi:hypothetical protein